MDSSPSTVRDNELLYRQLNDKKDPLWFHNEGQPPIPVAYFRPSSSDSDGLSLLRACQRNQKWAAYQSHKPDIRFKLARLCVETLISHGMTLSLSPDELDSKHKTHAHAEIPELSITLYKGNKTQRTETRKLTQLLADKICLDVIGPFEPPDETTPILPNTSA